MKNALILVFFFSAVNLLAQTSAVTATLTDPDGQTWNNGTYTINFVPTPGVPGPYTWNGGQSFTQQFKGSFSNAGVLTVSLPSSNFIAPAGSQWRFTLCPNASFQCTDVVLGVSGASPNLSSALSSKLPAIRIGPGASSFAYLDIEVGTPAQPLFPGALYWNVSLVQERQWTGSVWTPLTGGGGGSVTNVSGTANQINVANPTTTPVISIANPVIFPGPFEQNGSSSGTVTVQPQTNAGTWTFQWPNSAGSNGQSLITNGSGVTSWSTVTTVPGGSNTQVQFNNAGAFGGISNVGTCPSSTLTSQGASTTPSFVVKPEYDMADCGLAQNGVTDDTTALTAVLNAIGTTTNADLVFTGPAALEPVVFTPNITVRMQQKGALVPISTSTAPGGAGFVQGNGISNVNTLTSSCSVTLTGTTTGNSLIFMETHFFTGAVIAVGTVTDSQGGYYRQLVQQGFNFSTVKSAWAHGNIAGGSVAVTVQYVNNLGAPINVANGCMLWEISGMGPVVGTDAATTAVESNSGSLVMSAGAITTTTGALVIGFGGQEYLNQSSCTPAAGFTQPAGAAGFISGGSQPSTGYGFNLCASYKLSSPGGAQTPTITITNDPLNVPLNKYWSFAAISLIPASSIITIQGPISAPAKQIFSNALPGQGTIDLTGNTVVDKVFPEWWGACGTCTATANTNGIQAAVNAAFGTNRINGSQANQFNRELHFGALYNVNGTITPQHMNGAHWTCSERFACGFNQTTANTSILTTTCAGTYWALDHFLFQTTASQDLSHPLVDLNFTCTGGSDLVNQFIDFHEITFNGNKLAAIGLRGSAVGGGGQYSNINHYNNLWEGFTEAGYMLGSGSGCTATTLATNAIAINIFNGDFSGNNAYAFENFGGGQIHFESTSFENGFGAATNEGIQTGYDICGQAGSSGEGVILDDVRSESKNFLGGNGPYTVRNSFNSDQAFVLTPGSTPVINTEIQGSHTAGHGVYYTVTTGGTWAGSGFYPNSALYASSGTATTVVNTNQIVSGTVGLVNCQRGETMTQAVTGSTGTLLNGLGGTISMQITPATGSPDSSHTWTGGTTGCVYTPTSAPTASANYTSNQWVGYYISGVTGTCNYQYGIITANTANTVTFSGGWLTDFPDYITSFVNADTNCAYIIEPQWGVQTNNNGVIWTADTTKVTGLSAVYNSFFPGLQVVFQSAIPIVDRMQVTRADWNGNAGDADNPQVWSSNGVTAGTVPATGTGIGQISGPPFRRYKNIRNGITEIALAQPNGKGTSVDHWLSGGLGGATATGDTYWGLNPNQGAGTKKGFQYLTNNSSGVQKTWTWNFDGSSNAPGAITATDFEGTIGATTPTTGAFTTLSSTGAATLGSGVTQLIKTNTASNSDLAGELSFSGTTTSSTYSFTGTYTSHPECTITPQFSPGAGHVIWISTLTTGSLQLSSDTAQTGAVSYTCLGRN